MSDFHPPGFSMVYHCPWTALGASPFLALRWFSSLMLYCWCSSWFCRHAGLALVRPVMGGGWLWFLVPTRRGLMATLTCKVIPPQNCAKKWLLGSDPLVVGNQLDTTKVNPLVSCTEMTTKHENLAHITCSSYTIHLHDSDQQNCLSDEWASYHRRAHFIVVHILEN